MSNPSLSVLRAKLIKSYKKAKYSRVVKKAKRPILTLRKRL